MKVQIQTPHSKFLPVLVAVLMAACSAQKQLSDMHDDTHDLDQQTHGLSDKTDTLVKDSDHLSAGTDHIVQDSDHIAGTADASLDQIKLSNTTATDIEGFAKRSAEGVEATLPAVQLSEQKVAETLVEVTNSRKSVDATLVQVQRSADLVQESLKHIITTEDNLHAADMSGIHGGSLQLRKDLINEFLSRPPNEGKAEIADLARGLLYQFSFDYQQWQGLKVDTFEHRALMGSWAAEEFLRMMPRFYDSTFVLPNPMSQDPRDMALLSLASTMSKADPKQSEMIADYANDPKFPPIPEMTMLSMVEEALKADVEVQAGRKTYADYADKPYIAGTQKLDDWGVLGLRTEALYLLQVRLNYDLYLGMGSMIQDELSVKPIVKNASGTFWDWLLDSKPAVAESFYSGIKESMVDIQKEYISGFCGHTPKGLRKKASFAGKSDAEIGVTTVFFQGAWNQTQFLKSINVKPQHHCVINALFADVDTSEIVPSSEHLSPQRAQMVGKLNKLLTDLRAEVESSK